MWYCTHAITAGYAESPSPLNVYQLVSQVFAFVKGVQSVDISWVDECAARAGLLARLVDRRSLIETSGGYIPDCLDGRVEFCDVHFAYSAMPDCPVLCGLSISANPGETLALVGQSGCGKSTIMSLLLRFYDVNQGQILLDGVDVREYDPRWLRARVAHVSQEVQLFSMSILDNICLGCPSATYEQVVGCMFFRVHYNAVGMQIGLATLGALTPNTWKGLSVWTNGRALNN